MISGEKANIFLWPAGAQVREPMICVKRKDSVVASSSLEDDDDGDGPSVTFADIMRRTDTSCDISVLAYQQFQAKKSTILLAIEYV